MSAAPDTPAAIVAARLAERRAHFLAHLHSVLARPMPADATLVLEVSVAALDEGLPLTLSLEGEGAPALPGLPDASWAREPLLTSEEEAAATVYEDGPDGREPAWSQPAVDRLEEDVLLPWVEACWRDLAPAPGVAAVELSVEDGPVRMLWRRG